MRNPPERIPHQLVSLEFERGAAIVSEQPTDRMAELLAARGDLNTLLQVCKLVCGGMRGKTITWVPDGSALVFVPVCHRDEHSLKHAQQGV